MAPFAGPEGITQVELFKRMHLPIKKHAKRVRKLVEAAGIEVQLAMLPMAARYAIAASDCRG